MKSTCHQRMGAFVKMSLSLLLMAALAVGAPAQTVRSEQKNNNAVVMMEQMGAKPTFCKTLECPLYKVVMKNAAFELREYEPTLWAQTNVKNIDYSEATRTNFMKLFYYISGQNDQKQKIPMTVPVLNRIIPGEGPACESDFTLSFYLSQDKALFNTYPKPTDSSIKLVTTPKMKVYVRSFSGYYMRYQSWRTEAEKLIADVGDTSQYDTSAWYTAGYDSPFTLFNRHNEIWFLAKSEQNLQ